MKDLQKQIEELKTGSEYIYESIHRDTFYDFGSCLEEFEEFSNKTLELLEEYKESSRWRKVEEELPEVGVKVLVRTNKSNLIIAEMYIPKDCKGTVLGNKEWKGSYDFKTSIIEWKPIV